MVSLDLLSLSTCRLLPRWSAGERRGGPALREIRSPRLDALSGRMGLSSGLPGSLRDGGGGGRGGPGGL